MTVRLQQLLVPQCLVLADFSGVGFEENGCGGQIELRLGVGVGGVEVGDGWVEELGDGEVGFANAVDDAAGEFVCAVAVEVSVIVDGLGLVREGVGGVVHESFDAAFGS